jgi:hypothetical protein
MANQKKILEHCINFDEIVNCDFLEDDVLTKRLIEYYRDYVFNINDEDEKQLKHIRELDNAMHHYVRDYRFAKKLKETLDVDAVVKSDFPYLEQLMKFIIQFLEKYENDTAEVFVQTRWI